MKARLGRPSALGVVALAPVFFAAGEARAAAAGREIGLGLGVFGRFEIEGAGRIVYSQGTTKTRPTT